MKTNIIDNPKENDNRNYNYQGLDFYERAEFPIINQWLKHGSKVIDLGCGNASLIKYILDRKSVDIHGVELSLPGVRYAVGHGYKVKNGRIDEEKTYQEYSEDEFDYSICNVTLQMVMYPEIVIKQMKRISRYQIISFPNFAYLKNRIDLLINGRMPLPMLHGYSWYNTGHIHQLSIKDFKIYCLKHGIKIIDSYQLGCLKFIANYFWSNLFSKEAVYLCSK